MSKAKPYDPARAMRQRLNVLATREAARVERGEVNAGIAETVTLAEAKGGEFEKPTQAPGRQPPVRRLSGLAWLSSKDRLSALQMRAGLAYAEAFQGSRPPTGPKSCLNDAVGGSGVNVDFMALQRAMQRRLVYEARLARMRRRLGNQTDILKALDTICGEERTPREASANGQDAHALEAVLRVGLDLLAGEIPQVQE